MPFMVGLSLIALGIFTVWGGVSGRLASMIAAFGNVTFKTAAATTASANDNWLLPVQPSQLD